MNSEVALQAKLATVVKFPVNYFLENLAVCSSSSLLVTVLNHRELWYIPLSNSGERVEPLLLCSFDQNAMGIVEIEPDLFIVCTSNLWTDHKSFLHRLDLRGWTPGEPTNIKTILEFPERALGLNGACLIAPNTIVVADSFAGLIWRVDLASDGTEGTARVWLQHKSMSSVPDGPAPEQPGINGLAYAAKSHYLYYTSTAQQLFMRVRVDPLTGAPAGEPEFIADGMMGDDLCVDEDAGVAYIATHRQNTIDRVILQPGERRCPRNSVAGDPFTEELLGPTTGRWGRLPGQHGKVAFFLTDGGIKAPMPDGSLREPRVLRIEF
ncbi:YncE family protein [Trinickia mobilis]|uniref:YncE family protein n=1 Tax=Trinickia mobilis TaxID=2816356 RepID=UPI001A902CF1|nr:hypothetical protein [Trinickia mobilis]